jgi:hypothetical protein
MNLAVILSLMKSLLILTEVAASLSVIKLTSINFNPPRRGTAGAKSNANETLNFN